MMPAREITNTGVVTSAVGFGCAGLFWIPRRRDRRVMLDAAYDAGIRHFDVAPMYGLGLAETELAAFLRSKRSDVTVTTKFGIAPTRLTRSAASLQGPIRGLLAKKGAVQAGLKKAGRGPGSGYLGRLLYSACGYDRRSAQLALDRSLRALRTEWIDVFLLHDPVGQLNSAVPELVDYLDGQCQRGRIRTWGMTGPESDLPLLVQQLSQSPVLQYRDDILGASQPAGMELMPNSGSVTYGALARALPEFRRYLTRSQEAASKWSPLVGMDLAHEPNLPKLLLQTALKRNTNGPVLFTTTRPERALTATEAASEAAMLTDAQTRALEDLAKEVRYARPEVIQTS